MTTLNLDQKAAQYAQKMVINAEGTKDVKKPIDTLERLVTKTLGVLQEQGVYAAILFLYSRTSDEAKIAPAIRCSLFRLMQDREKNHELYPFKDKSVPTDDADAETALAFYSGTVCNDLDTLLLVKDLYEQTLIYARYGAKAAGNELAAI
ncbi:MAG: hypothetical protein H6650_21855 [Ardenticatenales bacterium]|nr:hypothetical protein [Ardenticatenales bacterium]